MCGLAGFSLHPDERVDAKQLAVDLLQAIETRGKDATGAAWWTGDKASVQKDALPAREFVQFLNLPINTNVSILHTRAATQGSEQDCNNNHPVIAGNIIGVHNGVLWNDDSLYRRMGIEDRRVGLVDTEAIFASIAYGQERRTDGSTRLGDNLREILEQVNGSASIGWLNLDEGPETLHVARISSSPLVWAQTKIGSFIFASTEEAIRKAVNGQSLGIDCIVNAAEGVHLKVVRGRVETVETFEPPSTGFRTVHTTITRPSSFSPVTKAAQEKGEKQEDIGKAPDIEALMEAAIFHDTAEHLLNPHHLSEMGSADYFNLYDGREASIEEVLQKETEKNPDQAVNFIRNNFGFVHPGCWIHTSFGDLDNVRGQIVSLPNEFPDGDYIIKLYIPNTRYPNNHEPILVSRTPWEFEELKPGEVPKEKDN